jgi:transposase, IS5 family
VIVAARSAAAPRPGPRRVIDQLRSRLRGEPIRDRLVSLADRDCRPIRKGTPSAPTQFGDVAQITEIRPSTRRGARGLILPVTIQRGNPGQNDLLPGTVSELATIGIRPREVAVDGGFRHAHNPRRPRHPTRQRSSSPAAPTAPPGREPGDDSADFVSAAKAASAT